MEWFIEIADTKFLSELHNFSDTTKMIALLCKQKQKTFNTFGHNFFSFAKDILSFVGSMNDFCMIF